MPTLLAFNGDDVAQIILVAPSVPFEVDYDFTAVLPVGDTVASATWTTGNPALVITPVAPSGEIASASFANTMPEGQSALISVQITSTAGKVESRSFRAVAVWR